MSKRQEPSPIACRIDALTSEERKRRSEVLAVLRGRVVRVFETEDGIGLQLPGDADVAVLAGEFVAFESRCCPFIRFTLEVEADGGPVHFQLGGRPGVKDFLRAEFLQSWDRRP